MQEVVLGPKFSPISENPYEIIQYPYHQQPAVNVEYQAINGVKTYRLTSEDLDTLEHEIAQRVGLRIHCLIASNETADMQTVLGLATGGTMDPLYSYLNSSNVLGRADDLITFNLDEYIGLPLGDPRKYEVQMSGHFGDDCNEYPVWVPNGVSPKMFVPNAGKYALSDPYQAAALYEADYRAAGVQLQMLGIGKNGHVAFNEPGATAGSVTRVVDLDFATRDANKRFFGGSIDAVPKQAVTVGIDTIMSAEELLLIAIGPDKTDPLTRMLHGDISSDTPASFLRKHPNITVICDASAGSELQFARR